MAANRSAASAMQTGRHIHDAFQRIGIERGAAGDPPGNRSSWPAPDSRWRCCLLRCAPLDPMSAPLRGLCRSDRGSRRWPARQPVARSAPMAESSRRWWRDAHRLQHRQRHDCSHQRSSRPPTRNTACHFPVAVFSTLPNGTRKRGMCPWRCRASRHWPSRTACRTSVQVEGNRLYISPQAKNISAAQMTNVHGAVAEQCRAAQ